MAPLSMITLLPQESVLDDDFVPVCLHSSDGPYFGSVICSINRAVLWFFCDFGEGPKNAPAMRARNWNAKGEPQQLGLTFCVPVLCPEVGPEKTTILWSMM